MSMQKYLANLVLTQLKGGKPNNIPDNIEVEKIFDIAGRGHMNYMLLGPLLNTDNFPEEKINEARYKVQSSILITLAQVTELKRLVEAFEEAGIRNLPMKGSCMKYMYPSPEMREMSDIDILVDDNMMEKAGKVMTELGYKLAQSVKHHDVYFKGVSLVIEVHRSMYDKTVDGNQYDYFKSFDRAILKEGYKYTYELGKEDFYVYMIAHMAKHFFATGCGIRNLVDVYIYLEKYGNEMDRSYLNKELKKCGIYEFAVNVEELAYIWLGGKKGSQFYDELFQYMVDCGIYGKNENGIWHKFAEEKQSDKKLTRFQLKKWYYFPPLFYMAEYYPWLEKFPFLLPVAWCIRACRGIFMKEGTQKREMLKVIDGDKAKTYQNIYKRMKLKFKHK